MKINNFTGVIAGLVMACALPVRTNAEAPVIHGHIVGPAEWIDYTSGIYSFAAEAPLTLNLEKESLFILVNGGGDYYDGRYYYLSNNDGLGLSDNYRMYVYDADTWIPKNNFRVPGNWYSADFATDPATGRLYGSFTTDGVLYRFGWMDRETGEFHSTNKVNTGYLVTGVNRYGAVYAISQTGKVYAINTHSGASTELFETGLRPNGMQTGCFDPTGDPDILYWCYRNADDHTALYTVDIKGGKEGVTRIGSFPMQEIVGGSYIRPESKKLENAPAPVTALKATTAGSKTTVSFTLPTATASGTSLAGRDITYVVVADGEMPSAMPTAKAGETVKLDLTLEDGEHVVAVTPACGSEIGSPVAVTFFVGPDTPQPVTELYASRQGDTFKATWTAPTAGENGGTINADAIVYEVKFFTGEQAETFTVSAPAFEKTVTSVNPVNCHVEVVAVDGNLKSKSVTSGNVMMGQGFTLPYSTDFTNGKGADMFLALDANSDGVTWFYESFYDDMRTNYKYDDGDMDDWLFTPILALDTEHFYHLQFDAKTAGLAYEELMEVKAGQGREPADMTVQVMPETVFSGASDKTYDSYFTVPTAGTWNVGFHSVTKGENFYIAIDNLLIERGGVTTAPAAPADVVISPNESGALNCAISLTAPTLNLKGEPISGNLKVIVKRNGRTVAQLADVAPGSEVKFDKVNGSQGVNKFQFVCTSSEGQGMPAQMEAYLGVDVPMPPTDAAVTLDSRGCPVVTWQAPVKGVNGGVINPEGIRYSVRRAYDKQFIAESVRDLTATDRLGLESDGQAIMYYEIYATNDAGTSTAATTRHFLLGDPYSLPFCDSFKDALEMHGPWLGVLLDNPEGYWYIDGGGTRPGCDPVDDDGGLMTFTPPVAGHTASITTPMISIDDADYPTLEVFVMFADENDSRLDISVSTADTDPVVVRSFSLNDPSYNPGWNLLQIPLAEFAGHKYVQVTFTGTAGEDYINHIHLDRIGIFDIPQYDVSAALLEVPDQLTIGRQTSFFATVTNTGVETVNDIEVTLLREEKPVATQKLASLAPGLSHTVALKDVADLTFDEITNYSFTVSAPDDRNPANDHSAVHQVDVALPHYPAPKLSGSIDGSDALLSWEAPDCRGVRAPVTDGFESYDPFIIDNVGPWTMVDIDGNPGTTGILDGNGNPLEYDNAGAKMAFQVFNPLLVGFPIYDEDGSRSMYAARRGMQMLCAFCDLDGYNNDWLISPVLPGEAQTISFYAKSYSSYYGLEAFIIMASTTDSTEPSAFKELTQVVNAPADWTKYEVTLPAGTKRFAIRCISIDQFALCVDDVKYIPASSPATDLTLTGYNVYRDGVLAATAPADATSIRVPMTADEPRAEFRISALYNEGESVMSNSVGLLLGIESVSAGAAVEVRAIAGGLSVTQPDDSSVDVYGIDGIHVARLTGTSTLALSPAVYIVRTPARVVKIAVR